MSSQLTQSSLNQDLLNFLNASPTPFHAVKNIKIALEQAGFQCLSEADSWDLNAGGKYYVTRNDSSIVAFTLAQNDLVKNGFQMVGAHTDSPCLKVNPNPEKHQKGFFQLGIEVYGGVLLNPWFDRDLSIAGRVNYETDTGEIKSALLNFVDPVAVIPSLAIHLDREVNESRSIDKNKHLPPVLMLTNDKKISFNELILDQLKKRNGITDCQQILDHELFFYDTQAAAITGYHQEFISSARLDNLLSCYVGLRAMINSNPTRSTLLVCNDHEEVGSVSASGAQGPLLKSILQRIVDKNEDFTRCIHHSMMISADNAHGIHPNFADKHDENHGPLINKGPVIKLNTNQRYATNSDTSAIFRQICQQTHVDVQSFVMRADLACGSTIGPITAAELGVKTVDIGVPTFAMHSIREMAGVKDVFSLYKVLVKYYSN